MTRVKLIGLAVGMALALALAGAACSGDDEGSPAVTTNTPTQAVTTAPTTAGTSPAAASGTPSPTTTAPASAASPAATAAAASPAAGAAQTFEIRAGERSSSEYFFEPKELTASAGKVTFKLTNGGPERPHTFVVRKDGAEVGRIGQTQPGQTQQVDLTLTAGAYEFICGLPGHANRGQRGTLTVR